MTELDLDSVATLLAAASTVNLSNAEARQVVAALIEHGLTLDSITSDVHALGEALARADDVVDHLAAAGFDYPGQAVASLDGATSRIDVMVRHIMDATRKD